MAVQGALGEEFRLEPGLDFDDRPGPAWWSERARCRGATHLFFGPDRERPGRRGRREVAARALCGSCPVLEPCRTWARANREYGFWGGESEDERADAGFRPALSNRLPVTFRVPA